MASFTIPCIQQKLPAERMVLKRYFRVMLYDITLRNLSEIMIKLYGSAMEKPCSTRLIKTKLYL